MSSAHQLVAPASQDAATARVASLLLVTWVGVNALWGLLSPGDTFVSALLQRALPLGRWVALCFLLLLVAGVVARGRRHAGLVTVAALLAAYLAGVWASEIVRHQINVAEAWLRPMVGGAFPLVERSALLLPVVPMLGVLGSDGNRI